MPEQKLTELIDHNAKPMNDLDAYPAEPTCLVRCLGLAAVFGAICGFGVFLILLWMKG